LQVESFGARLRARRRELGLSQAQLGALAASSQEAVSEYEIGVPPHGRVLYRLLDALELPYRPYAAQALQERGARQDAAARGIDWRQALAEVNAIWRSPPEQ